MHLKVFMKLEKTLKTLSSGQKNPKKPKKTQKTQKNPLVLLPENLRAHLQLSV